MQVIFANPDQAQEVFLEQQTFREGCYQHQFVALSFESHQLICLDWNSLFLVPFAILSFGLQVTQLPFDYR